jgi:hypothetical protein
MTPERSLDVFPRKPGEDLIELVKGDSGFPLEIG